MQLVESQKSNLTPRSSFGQRLQTTFRLVASALLAVVVAAAIYGSFEEVGFDPAFPRHDNLGDFGSFYESGRAALHGQNPYDIYPLTYFAAAGKAGAAVNLNAPFSVVLFEPLSSLAPIVSARVFNMAAFIAYAGAIGVLLKAFPAARQPWRLIWALGLSSFWGTLALGQIYAFLTLAAAIAWWCFRNDRYTIAGLLIGLIAAIKPNFLIWPVLLLIAGNRRAAFAALAAFSMFSLIPAIQLGPQVYRQWAEAALSTGANGAPTNGALTGLAVRLGFGSLGMIGGAITLVGVTIWARMVRPESLRLSAAAITTTLLVSPLAWTGYAVLTVPIFFSRAWGVAMLCAAALLLVPVGSVLLRVSQLSSEAMAIVGSTYTWVWLLILVSAMMEPSLPSKLWVEARRMLISKRDRGSFDRVAPDLQQLD